MKPLFFFLTVLRRLFAITSLETRIFFHRLLVKMLLHFFLYVLQTMILVPSFKHRSMSPMLCQFVSKMPSLDWPSNALVEYSRRSLVRKLLVFSSKFFEDYTFHHLLYLVRYRNGENVTMAALFATRNL